MSITLKIGQVWKIGKEYIEIVNVGNYLTTIRVTPVGTLSTLGNNFVENLLDEAVFLGEARMPTLRQVFKHRKSGALSEMYAVYSSPKVEVRDLNSPENISHYKSYFALLEDYEYLGEMPLIGKTYTRGKDPRVVEVTNIRGGRVGLKKVGNGARYGLSLRVFLSRYVEWKVPAHPQPLSVFFDRKTDSILCYEKMGMKYTLRNLKNGVLHVFSRLEILGNYEFLGIHPKVGDEFTRNGGTVKISGFDKANVLLGRHPAQLYGRESFMPLYVLMTTWVRKDTSKADGLYPWQRDMLELIRSGYLARPVVKVEDTNYIFGTGDVDMLKPSAQDRRHSSTLWGTQWGRMLRPDLKGVSGKKADFIILDYAVADVDLTGNWFSFCAKPHHATGLTLLPQVGDVYKTKFFGNEVKIIKVGKRKLTVEDGLKTWKVSYAELAESFKWVR